MPTLPADLWAWMDLGAWFIVTVAFRLYDLKPPTIPPPTRRQRRQMRLVLWWRSVTDWFSGKGK